MRRGDIDASLADLARLHAEDDDTRAADLVLQVIETLSPAEGANLRRELDAIAHRPLPLRGYRFESGTPRPYRPRDLAWSIVDAALEVAR